MIVFTSMRSHGLLSFFPFGVLLFLLHHCSIISIQTNLFNLYSLLVLCGQACRECLWMWSKRSDDAGRSTWTTAQKLSLETITDSSPLWLRRWTATEVPWAQAHHSDNHFVLFSFFAFLFVLFPKENSIDCISISFDHRPFLFRQLYCSWSYLQSHTMSVGAQIKLMIAVWAKFGNSHLPTYLLWYQSYRPCTWLRRWRQRTQRPACA